MARTSNGSPLHEPLSTGLALPTGARVWLLQEGCPARIVACAQGGLLYRVRLERDGTVIACPGCGLLPLAGGEADPA